MKVLYIPVSQAETEGDGFLTAASQWKPEKYDVVYKGGRLKGRPRDTRLYVVGHGQLGQPRLQKLTADELFKQLKAEGLDTGQEEFRLYSCYSGVRVVGQERSFAEEFAWTIKDHFKRARVYGYLGLTRFSQDDGVKQVKSDILFSRNHNLPREAVEHRAGDQKVSFQVEEKKKFLSTTRSVVPGVGDAAYKLETEKVQRLEKNPYDDELVPMQYSRWKVTPVV